MPERPSRVWHEPFLEAPAKTRNVDKAASAGMWDAMRGYGPATGALRCILASFDRRKGNLEPLSPACGG